MDGRRFAGSIVVLGLAIGGLVVQAGPALAACASSPGTNAIYINPGPPFRPIVIPGIPGGTVTACAEVTGGGQIVVGRPTVQLQPIGCGVPCFVVAWDGVSNDAVTVSGTVSVGAHTYAFSQTIPAGSYGSFCIKAGMPCP